MLPTIVTGFAAFYGGQPLLSSPPRSRACVAHHMGDAPHEPLKTAQGVDVKVAAADISRLLREQDAEKQSLVCGFPAHFSGAAPAVCAGRRGSVGTLELYCLLPRL